MAYTAAGLFVNAGAADAVVHALGANGFPSNEIRVMEEPTGSAVTSATSTPRIDFEAALTRDLRSMGASESECESYTDGLRRGNVLIFANGTKDQADAAAQIMASHHAIEVEEFVGAASTISSPYIDEVGTLNPKRQAGEDRVKREGVRVFSW